MTVDITDVGFTVVVDEANNAVTVTSPGPQGVAGPAGATGPAGAKGDKGDPGDPGDAATIAAGTTTTLSPGASATVANSGTSSAAVFDFGIPQGDQGATGPSGVVSVTAPITNSGTSTSANLALSTGTGLTTTGGTLAADIGTTSTTLASGDRGLPSGGTSGQVLAKASGTNYDGQWIGPVADGRAVYSRPLVNSGLPRPLDAATFAGVKSANIRFCSPFAVNYACTIDQIGIYCQTAAADTSVRLGIYKERDGTSELDLIVDAGAVSMATDGEKIITLSPAVELPAGRIWIMYGAFGTGTPSNIRVRVHTPVTTNFYVPNTTSTQVFSSDRHYARFNSATYTGAAYPATFDPPGRSAEAAPLYWLRVASVL